MDENIANDLRRVAYLALYLNWDFATRLVRRDYAAGASASLWLSDRQAARYLCVDVITFRFLVSLGSAPAAGRASPPRWRLDDLDEFVEGLPGLDRPWAVALRSLIAMRDAENIVAQTVHDLVCDEMDVIRRRGEGVA